MKKRGPLIVAIVIAVGGLAMIAGAVLNYQDEHSGTPGKAKVATCSGNSTRYGRNIHCEGTWVAGGSLPAGGHVVYGSIVNAGKSDVGKEISVRIHGTDHATVPNMRVTVILAVFGVALAAFGVWLVLRPPGTRRTRPA